VECRSTPLHRLRAGGEQNAGWSQFSDPATIAAVSDAAPDLDGQLIIALARYGGLLA